VRTRRSPVVLGVCSFTHDSAAALVADGRLAGMAEEERLSGVKHTKDYPRQSIAWLLADAGLTADGVDIVAYNFAGHRYLAGAFGSAPYLLPPATRGRALPRAASFAAVYSRYRSRMRALRQAFPNAGLRAISHHTAHGLYAFAASGYERAAVLIADSLGETCTTSIGHAHAAGDRIRYQAAQAIHDPASLGYAYGAVTEHLGWRRGDEEGTVMALAALGDPARFRAVLAQAIPITPEGFALDPSLLALRVLRHGWPRVTPAFTRATCPPRREGGEVIQVHADLAAALQERTEKVMIHLARRARKVTGASLLCVGGGVAMNCLAIGKIISEGLFGEVFVPPAPGDAGTAIGAAIAAHLRSTDAAPTGVARGCYLGPSYPDFQPGPHPLPGLAARQVAAPARCLAAQLAEGKIAGVFQGRLEAGPRALGNRSILASPLLPGVTSRLNAAVKFREPFRPFAPVVLADRAAGYFQITQPSPYMSVAVPVTALARALIPAVVHANGTARVQTLTHDDNPLLHDVLRRFAALTGIPVLINTSLNVKGKPICGTPQMALECLATTGLDGLLLDGGWWVTQRDGG
jgi:carbamoyltransferase